MAKATKDYRAGKAAAANTRAGRNEKAAGASMTLAGASVIGGGVGVATLGVAGVLAAGVHSKAARADRAQASRITARENAIEKVENKRKTGSTFGRANKEFETAQASKPAPSSGSSGRGWGNPKVQAAAKAAQGKQYNGPK